MGTQRIWIGAILSVSIVLLAGCGGGGSNEAVDNPTPVTPVPDKALGNAARVDELNASLSILRGEIDSIIEQTQSCHFHEDCENLAVGELSQGCGDADTYLAYSPPPSWELWSWEKEELTSRVAEYNALDKELDTLMSGNQVVSAVCQQNPPPAVGCVYGKCTNDQQQIQAFKRYYQQLQDDWERLSREINTLVGNAQCATALDCRSIAFGHKPCGGPSSFLAYSVLTTDSQQLAPKVEEFNELARTFDSLHGYASDCSLVMPQPVECVNNQCQETSRYFPDQSTGVSEPTDADSVGLKMGINVLLGNLACTSSEQCADVAIEYSGDACTYEERIAFSMANPPDMPLLASKIRQYTQKVAEEMTNLATDGKISGYFSTDLQLGSCVQGQCAGRTVKSLFCNDLTGKKTATQ